MAFDLSTAKPVQGFDISTAKPVEDSTSTASTPSTLTPSTNEQKSGYVPTKEDLIYMLPKKEDVLPLAGMMIGGSTGGIPGAALGSSAGTAYTQLLKRLGLIGGEAPQTSMESAKDIGLSGIKGALAETANKFLVNPIMGKIGKFLFPGADVTTQEAVKTAEQEGIKALPSMISKSKAVAGTERALEYSPFGNSITKARDNAVQQFGDYAKRVGESISPTRDPEVNGSLIKEATKGFYDVFNDVKNKLYNSVFPQIKDKPVDLSNTLNAIQNLITSRSGEAQPFLVNEARNWLENATGKEIPSKILDKSGVPFASKLSSTIKTFEELKKFGSNIGDRSKFFDPSNPGMQGQLKGLWGAIQNDLDNALEKYGDDSIKQSLDKAKEYFHIGKTLLDGKTFNALVNAPQGMEYKIALNRNDPMSYDTVKNIVGNDLMGGLSRQWFNDIINQSTKNGITSPQLILNKLDKNSALLSKIAEDFPAASAQIEKLKSVASLMTKNSDVIRGSQTGAYNSLMATLAELGASVAALFVNPTAGLSGLAMGGAALGASKAGTSAITSDVTRSILTKGYSAIQPQVEKTVGVISRPTLGMASSMTLQKLKDLIAQKYQSQ